MVRGQELGARLEQLQSELEQAALERQEFLQEQELQHQRCQPCPRGRGGQARAGGGGDDKAASGRYQSLEKLLEAELQAAATSKEEALMELKKRALQLEEELYQVRLPPGELGATSHPPSGPSSAPSGPVPFACLVPPFWACWRELCAESQADSAWAWWSSGGLVSPFLKQTEPNGFALRRLLCFSRSGPTTS